MSFCVMQIFFWKKCESFQKQILQVFAGSEAETQSHEIVQNIFQGLSNVKIGL